MGENRFDISYAKNLTPQWYRFFLTIYFWRKPLLWKNHMPDGNSSKNRWKSVEGENRENKRIGEKMKGQRFFSRSAYFWRQTRKTNRITIRHISPAGKRGSTNRETRPSGLLIHFACVFYRHSFQNPEFSVSSSGIKQACFNKTGSAWLGKVSKVKWTKGATSRKSHNYKKGSE